MNWSTWCFDCDGVLLDSNTLKTAAFRKIGLRFGVDAARELVEDHVRRGGISRFVKLRHFVDEVLGDVGGEEDIYEELLRDYAELVREGYLHAPLVAGLRSLLEYLTNDEGRSLYVVSGSAQDELREVLLKKGIAGYFHGIYGSPRSKEEILNQIVGASPDGVVMVGDSSTDWLAAEAVGIDFIFVAGLTEWRAWQHELPAGIPVFDDLAGILRWLRE